MDNLPVIVIEVVMIFGGALAFGWWQLRDLDREKKKREQAQAQAQADSRAGPDPASAPAASEKPPHAP